MRTRHISAPVPDNASSRWLYRKATRFIVTTGEALREQLIARVGVDAARVMSVPTGIDLAHYLPADFSQPEAGAALRAQLQLATDAPTIGIVSTLRSWKGHRYLIEAVAALNDVQLVIVGDGPQRSALEAQVAALQLHERVRFTGNLKDVAPWLQAFDIFALPSYANEGVPQAIMQAMACGLPVVSTPVGSISEIVSHEETGLLVAPHDAASLRTALQRLLADSALRARLGAAGRALALARFSDKLMVQRMEQIFLDVAVCSHHDKHHDSLHDSHQDSPHV